MGSDVKFTISMAVSSDEIDMAKALFTAHEKELGEEACFQDFDKEMKNIQSIYAPPSGALLLAFNKNNKVASGATGEAIGVVGMVGVDEETAEMKRLYVMPEWRGRGIGKALCQGVLNTARGQLYKTMRLETLPRLEAAISLYLEYGFEIEDSATDFGGRDRNVHVMVASL